MYSIKTNPSRLCAPQVCVGIVTFYRKLGKVKCVEHTCVFLFQNNWDCNKISAVTSSSRTDSVFPSVRVCVCVRNDFLKDAQ